MIFEIDKSCIEKLKEGDADTCTALNNIAYFRRRGENLLISNRENLEFLKECEILEKNARHVYSSIFRKELLHFRTFKKEVNRYYTIVSDESVECENLYKLTIKDLIEKKFHLKTKFIAENLTDCEFYRNLGLYYSWKKSLLHDIKSDNFPGGGHTSAQLFDSKITENESLLFGIFDGDQKYLNASEGTTIQEVHKMISHKERMYFDYLSLSNFQTLEAENLIPHFIIESIADTRKTEQKNTISFLKNLVAKEDEAYFFFDMKKGIFKSERKGKEITYSQDYINYWQPRLDCFCKVEIPEKEIKEIKQVSVEGDNLLNASVKKLKSQENSQELQSIFDKIDKIYPLNSKWEEIGKEIYTWFCIGKIIN
jgi:hypothetical protein